MKDVRKVKQLKSQLSILEGDAEAMKIDISHRQKDREGKLRAINDLKRQIALLDNDQKCKVSEHAIVRYFERVKGFDIAAIEREILSDPILKQVQTLGGNGTYPNANGYSVVMKSHTVTTIVT